MTGVRDISGTSELGAISVRDASNTLVSIGEVWVRDQSNVLSQVFGALSASASPSEVFGSTSSGGTVTVSTGSTTVTVAPPGAATFSWTTSDPSWAAVSPTSATTQFRCTGVGPGDSFSTTFACAVTRGTATTTVYVTASADNFGHI